jgi:hypothetical protein
MREVAMREVAEFRISELLSSERGTKANPRGDRNDIGVKSDGMLRIT